MRLAMPIVWSDRHELRPGGAMRTGAEALGRASRALRLVRATGDEASADAVCAGAGSARDDGARACGAAQGARVAAGDRERSLPIRRHGSSAGGTLAASRPPTIVAGTGDDGQSTTGALACATLAGPEEGRRHARG